MKALKALILAAILISHFANSAEAAESANTKVAPNEKGQFTTSVVNMSELLRKCKLVIAVAGTIMGNCDQLPPHTPEMQVRSRPPIMLRQNGTETSN